MVSTIENIGMFITNNPCMENTEFKYLQTLCFLVFEEIREAQLRWNFRKVVVAGFWMCLLGGLCRWRWLMLKGRRMQLMLWFCFSAAEGYLPCHTPIYLGSYIAMPGNDWLVVYLPLWKTWKSIGMIIPNIWKNTSHVPNHQSDEVYIPFVGKTMKPHGVWGYTMTKIHLSAFVNLP